MFEKILERVLLSHFGKYLTGFDRNNLKLGVWSGNVVIENVKVKPEILERFLIVFLWVQFGTSSRVDSLHDRKVGHEGSLE